MTLRFRFSSEVFDSETGLIYYNYRYYNPNLGRWIKRDPIEEQGGWNLYAMVGNNTVILNDKKGKAWYDSIPLIGTATGHWNASTVLGAKASDYAGIEVSYDECCRGRADGGGYATYEAVCQRKLEEKAMEYMLKANAGLGMKTAVDLAVTLGVVALGSGPVGGGVGGIVFMDGVLGGWAIQRTNTAIKNGKAAASSNCSCSKYGL